MGQEFEPVAIAVEEMNYTLRIPEGMRRELRNLAESLSPAIVSEWIRPMRALCGNPGFATLLGANDVLPEIRNYSFEIDSHIFSYDVEISEERQTIDVVDFKHGRV